MTIRSIPVPSIPMPSLESATKCVALGFSTIVLGSICKLQPVTKSNSLITGLFKSVGAATGSTAITLGAAYGANRLIEHLFGQPVKQLYISLPVALASLGIISFINITTALDPNNGPGGEREEMRGQGRESVETAFAQNKRREVNAETPYTKTTRRGHARTKSSLEGAPATAESCIEKPAGSPRVPAVEGVCATAVQSLRDAGRDVGNGLANALGTPGRVTRQVMHLVTPRDSERADTFGSNGSVRKNLFSSESQSPQLSHSRPTDLESDNESGLSDTE